MQVRVGCEFVYQAEVATHVVAQVEPRLDGHFELFEDEWVLRPPSSTRRYLDSYGNLCRRYTIPAGESVLRYNAVVDVTGNRDPVALEANETAPADLPAETLPFTLPSRLCPSDLLGDQAWDLFQNVPAGWTRVQAICNWVHDELAFQYGSSKSHTTAVDIWESRTGVCRDFAHLALTLCRAFNIPARYAFGYLPDIGVPIAPEPMDFCAWIEVYLGGAWWTFDPRNNERRVGRVLIGRGRDAIDVAMVTTFGAPELVSMTVWADEVKE